MSKTPVSHPLSQAIYEGVLERPPWKTLLKRLEGYMQVSSATLVLRRPRRSDPGVTVYLYSDANENALEDFRNRGSADSPFAELPVKKVFTLADRVSSTEINSLEFCDYLRTYGVSDLIGFDVYDKQSHIRLRLRLVRIGDVSGFSQRDRTRLESIVPLMDNALKLYGAYAYNNFFTEFYDELLGSMDIASVIVNARLEVLSENQQARQVLAAKDGVFLRRNEFRCCSTTDQRRLQDACSALLNPEVNKNDRQALSIVIEREAVKSKWDVHVRRVSTKNFIFDEGGPEFVLLLQGPIRSSVPSQARLIDVFGVTPAEAKLIIHLVDSMTLTAAAKTLGISRNTARAQLASIFSKTGVNRQAQLVKLVSETFAAHWQ